MSHTPMLVQLTDTLAATEALDAPRGVVLGVSHSIPEAAAEVLEGETLLGHPAHPLVVMLPLGAWTSALLLDALGADEDAATALTGAGVAAVVGAALTGLADVRSASQENGRVAAVHVSSMVTATLLHVASYAARAAGSRTAGSALAVAGLTAAGVGGYLGGELSKRLSKQKSSSEG